MQIIPTPIADLVLIEPQVWEDDRGYFFESYNHQRHKALSLDYNWVQDNEAKSSRGVFRGLHFQSGQYAQAKLVRVILGAVLDIAVDLRPTSPTFKQHFSTELSEDNKLQLLVPRGFAHGYLCLSEEAIFAYKCDNYYHKDAEASIRYNDNMLNIHLPIAADELIISKKDLEAGLVEQYDFTRMW